MIHVCGQAAPAICTGKAVCSVRGLVLLLPGVAAWVCMPAWHGSDFLVPRVQTVNVHLPKNAKFGDVVNSQPQDYNFKCVRRPFVSQ